MRQQERLSLPAGGQVQSALFLPHQGHKPGQSALQSNTVGIWNINSWQAIHPHPDVLFRRAAARNPGHPDRAPLTVHSACNCLFPLDGSRQRAHSPCTNAFARSVIRIRIAVRLSGQSWRSRAARSLHRQSPVQTNHSETLHGKAVVPVAINFLRSNCIVHLIKGCFVSIAPSQPFVNTKTGRKPKKF